MFPKDHCDLLNEAIAQVKRRITVVRIAVAKFESTPVTPIFASIAVAPAKSADSNDQVSQLFIAVESHTRNHRNKIFAIMPLSSCFNRWQWKSDMPRMIGSVKSITRSTEPP